MDVFPWKTARILTMNRKFAIQAALYAFMVTFLFFRALLPQSTEFYVPGKMESGIYEPISPDGGYQLFVENAGDQSAKVIVEPETPWFHYGVGSFFAVLIGLSHYRGLLRSKAERNENDLEKPSMQDEPTVDLVYESFLQEDEARRFVPKATLSKEFEKWKSQRGDKDQSDGKKEPFSEARDS